MLCHFCHFLSSVLGVFNRPVATPAHGFLGLSPSLRLRIISDTVSLLALYICATASGVTDRAARGRAHTWQAKCKKWVPFS